MRREHGKNLCPSVPYIGSQTHILTDKSLLSYNTMMSTLPLTSLEEARTEPLANTAGLVTDTGLVKAESRLEDSEVGLCSLLLAFHWLGCNTKTNHVRWGQLFCIAELKSIIILKTVGKVIKLLLLVCITKHLALQ